MSTTGAKILAAGATGGRNELKFFESIPEENEVFGEENLSANFYPTYCITDFSGGV